MAFSPRARRPAPAEPTAYACRLDRPGIPRGNPARTTHVVASCARGETGSPAGAKVDGSRHRPSLAARRPSFLFRYPWQEEYT
jgi:hypothetical protein